MNSELEEIILLIENNVSNEDIINKRLEYLKSDEYKKERLKDINELDYLFGTKIIVGKNNNIIFKDGFIDEDIVISHESGTINWCDGYTIDISIYNELLNYIRENIELIKKQGGISIRSIMAVVRHYFSLSEESKYYNVCNILKEWYNDNSSLVRYGSSQLFIRYELPEIICSYRASDFNGSIEDYTNLYLKHYYLLKYGLLDENDLYQQINFDEGQLFSVLSLSELKNTDASACTEYSMLLQNYMCFIGYESYLIGGKANGGGHNYNVIKEDGKYRILDVGFLVDGIEISNIDTPYDLLTFGQFIALNQRKKDIIYESEFKNNDDIEKHL